MTDDKSAAAETPKSEWVKPEVALVEAGKAEGAPVTGPDGYYNYS
jgi:hypothetical protein